MSGAMITMEQVVAGDERALRAFAATLLCQAGESELNTREAYTNREFDRCTEAIERKHASILLARAVLEYGRRLHPTPVAVEL